MPVNILSCMSLPPATVTSVPIYDFSKANEELAKHDLNQYYPCCGKSICIGCVYSFRKSKNDAKCPFCNADRMDKTDAESIEEMMKRMDVNDAGAIYVLANYYDRGDHGLQQDHAKAIELYARAGELGYSHAHFHLGAIYNEGGALKKAKFHYEAAAMAGHELARSNLGSIEGNSGNMERAVKHFMIAASAGNYHALCNLQSLFEAGYISADGMDQILTAYNASCMETRSEARDEYINTMRTRQL
jgi:TPR repeat protein